MRALSVFRNGCVELALVGCGMRTASLTDCAPQQFEDRRTILLFRDSIVADWRRQYTLTSI